jgi:hypothetical protein
MTLMGRPFAQDSPRDAWNYPAILYQNRHRTSTRPFPMSRQRRRKHRIPDSQRPTPNAQHPFPWLLPVLAVALTAVAARLYLMRATHSTAEDFYITLRYAENLAGGHGFVYNAGERVLGTTTPLYTLYLALVARLGLDPVLFGKLANIFADGLSCWLVFRLAIALIPNPKSPTPYSLLPTPYSLKGAGLLAAALLAFSPPNMTWAISGMETSLVTLAGLAVFVAMAERRPTMMAVCAAALVMLRIDGLLLVLLAFAGLWLAKRRFPLRAAALFLALLAPWTLFAWVYFGSPVPTSVIAKLTIYAWHRHSLFPNLKPFALQMTHSSLHWLLLACALLSLLPLSRPRSGESGRGRWGVRVAILWLLLYYAAMAFSRSFLFGWYYVPPTPVYFLLAAVGGLWVVGSLGDWVVGRWALGVGRWAREHGEQSSIQNPKSPSPLPACLLAAAVIGFGLRSLPGVRADIAKAQAVENHLRQPIGMILRGLVAPGERLMLEPIGYIGFFSRARILDTVGLVSPEVIPYYRRGAASPYLDILADKRPEWVLLRAGEYWEAMTARVPPDRKLRAHYALDRQFFDPDAPPKAGPAFYLFRRK